MIHDPTRRGELAAALAGAEALARYDAAVVLYEAGGRHLLSQTARDTLRELLDRGVNALIGSPVMDLAIAASANGARELSSAADTELMQASGTQIVKQISRKTALAATKSVGAGMGRAAGVAMVVDGATSAVEAVRRYRQGEVTGLRAVGHVCRSASKGAVASAAGVGLAAAAVALTGGLGAPVVFGVGFLGTLGVRAGLDAVV